MIDHELQQAATDLRFDVDQSAVPPPPDFGSGTDSRSFGQTFLVAAAVLACIAGGVLLATTGSGPATRVTNPAEGGELEGEQANVPAPTDLQASVTSNRVSLSWSGNADVLGYNVYRDDSYLTTVFETTYVDNAVPSGQHQYYVTSFDETKTAYSLPSEVVTAFIAGQAAAEEVQSFQQPPLQVVQLLRAVSDHPEFSGTVLTWQDRSNIDLHAYNIYRDGLYIDTVEFVGDGSYRYVDENQFEFEGAKYGVHPVRVNPEAEEGFDWGPFIGAEWVPWTGPDE